jgi:hypothetical protein
LNWETFLSSHLSGDHLHDFLPGILVVLQHHDADMNERKIRGIWMLFGRLRFSDRDTIPRSQWNVGSVN